jgi:DNA (cytosine-5)-methyltransferase 1
MKPHFDLCGCMFGLPNLKRRRWFEIGNWFPAGLRVRCRHADRAITVLTSSPFKRVDRWGTDKRERVTHERASEAMGIDWMTPHGLGEAIPPAYAEFLGKLLMTELELMNRPRR